MTQARTEVSPRLAPLLVAAPTPVTVGSPGNGVVRTAAVLWALVAASWLVGRVLVLVREP